MDCSADFDNGIVTLPFFRWVFVLPVGTHPSARISRSISIDVIGICVLFAQLLYQNIRIYTIRIIVKRINKKKEVNPSLKYRVYM